MKPIALGAVCAFAIAFSVTAAGRKPARRPAVAAAIHPKPCTARMAGSVSGQARVPAWYAGKTRIVLLRRAYEPLGVPRVLDPLGVKYLTAYRRG
jgi:hypothetical protein